MTLRFEIVEAKPQHCGQMSRLLRVEHRSAIEALDINAHHELRACFDASAFRRAWLIDGALAALGGVTGGKLDVYGQIWLAFAPLALRYPIEVMKESKRQLAVVSQVKRKLVTMILLNDGASARFAQRLGFKVVRDETENFETAIMEYGRPISHSHHWH